MFLLARVVSIVLAVYLNKLTEQDHNSHFLVCSDYNTEDGYSFLYSDLIFHAFSVLCGEWGTILSNVPAICRHGSGSPFQHSIILSPDVHDCSCLWYVCLLCLLWVISRLVSFIWANFLTVSGVVSYFHCLFFQLHRSCSWGVYSCAGWCPCLQNSC